MAVRGALFLGLVLAAPSASPAQEGVPDPTPGDPVTLRDALDLAMARSPALAAEVYGTHAVRAQVEQAGRWSNPHLQVDFENVGGSGAYNAVDQAETTVLVSQTLELWRKPSRRRAEAAGAAAVADADLAIRRRELARDVTVAYVDALEANALLRVTEERIALVRGGLDRLERFRPDDAERARAELASLTALRPVREGRWLAAEIRLEAYWGDTAPEQPGLEIEGRLDPMAPAPSIEQLMAAVDHAPLLLRWREEVDRAQSSLALERENRIPDLDLGAGYRRLSASEDNVAVFLVGMPIPIFDRNRGNIAAASASLAEARARAAKARVELVRDLASRHQELSSAHLTAGSLHEDAVPRALDTLESLRDDYANGRAGYIDLQDARDKYYEVRRAEISALAAYHRSVAEVEYLVDVDAGPEP